jgi:toxin-antitoxin system PIN domain toxin
MKIIDVNVLIYAVNRQSQFHSPVLSWWNAALNGSEQIGLPWITISGFLRIMTNPRLLDSPLPVAEALDRVEAWLDQPAVSIVAERENHWSLFREFIADIGTGGNRTSDAHLAALAISRGAVLASCDRGFARFRQLRWENPAD